MGSRQEDLRPALFAAHIVNQRADPVTVLEHFPRNGFIAPNDGFTPSEIDDHIAVFGPFDDTVDNFADAVLELVELPVPFGFAHFLDDNLFGRLGRDPSEI